MDADWMTGITLMSRTVGSCEGDRCDKGLLTPLQFPAYCDKFALIAVISPAHPERVFFASSLASAQFYPSKQQDRLSFVEIMGRLDEGVEHVFSRTIHSR